MKSSALYLSLMLFAGRALSGDDATSKVPAISSGSNAAPQGYVLGANDQIKIEIVELEEFNGRTYRVDPDGTVSVPLVGRVRIAGGTLAVAEKKIADALRTQIQEPHVSLTLVETRSQPVSIVGEVNSPGVHQLEGTKTLYEVLAMAGGLKPDAGYQLKMTRKLQWGPIPIADAKVDQAENVSIAEIPTSAVLNANASKNIKIFPEDIISVPRADIVYVVGEVRKGGSIVLRQKNTISVTEAVSAAEGFSSTASPKNARILRPDPSTSHRTEIPVDLRKVLDGKGEDLALRPNDVLYIPNSASKRAFIKAAEIALQTASGVIIYH